MHLFDISSTQTESFNLGTIYNPKNILLAFDLTHEEREKIVENHEKRQSRQKLRTYKRREREKWFVRKPTRAGHLTT